MPKPNIQAKQPSKSVIVSQNGHTMSNEELPNQQASTKLMPGNENEISKICYPSGSLHNGSFIDQTDKEFSKPLVQQIDCLKQNAGPLNSPSHEKMQKNVIKSPQHEPQKLKNQQVSLKTALKHSKLLKAIFDYFSYTDHNKKTFEEMKTQNQTISLNRFMLFCKQFNIQSIIQFEVKSEPISMSRANTFHKTTQEIIEKSPSLYLSKAGKVKMLEIPVKEITKFEKIMISIFRSVVDSNQKMTFENFVHGIEHIFTIYTKYFNKICPQKQFLSESEIKNEFLSSILFIKSKKLFQQKMDSLKIGFKGQSSPDPEPQKKRQSLNYIQKPLVMHGGRETNEMKKQLEIYQSTKSKKTETWIGSQPQKIAQYSKSRVFYKPTPAKTYETNDVIRLARREAGRMHTQSLFNVNRIKQNAQIHKIPETVTFSKIFADKTNTFGEKLQKVKNQLVIKKQSKKNLHKQRDNEDEILRKYFENERNTYGNETFHLKHKK